LASVPADGLLIPNLHKALLAVHLHFYRIATVTPKIAQRKILLYLFEQQLYHPAVFINGGYL
jgi:hypothetical protein